MSVYYHGIMSVCSFRNKGIKSILFHFLYSNRNKGSDTEPKRNNVIADSGLKHHRAVSIETRLDNNRYVLIHTVFNSPSAVIFLPALHFIMNYLREGFRVSTETPPRILLQAPAGRLRQNIELYRIQNDIEYRISIVL